MKEMSAHSASLWHGAGNTVIAAQRFASRQSAMLPETVFDSPLQQAMHELSRLTEVLEERGDQEAMETIAYVRDLLQSKRLHGSGVLDEIAPDMLDDTVHDWLQSMDLIHKKQIRKSASAPAIVDQAHKPALLNPRVEVSSNESELMGLLESSVTQWDFDALSLDRLSNGRPLAALGWALFERQNLRQAFDIPAETLCTFLAQLEAAYKRVPYHNSAHGACVAHGSYFLATGDAIKGAVATPLDMFSLIFAALVHDVAHDGHNNAFHVATGSELALLYSDQSVLEMHHLTTAFRLLRAAPCNIVANMSTADAKQFRSAVISVVLATDLSQNFNVINSYKTMLETEEEADGTLGPPRTRGDERIERGEASLFSSTPVTLKPEEKLTVLKMAIKCADIGNVTKSKPVALAWTDRIIKEFFAQGDEERSLGMPVTPMLDRNSANVAKQQLGFYNFIVRPMYAAMDLLVDMGPQLANLDEMQEHWSAQMSAEESEKCGPDPVIRSSNWSSRRGSSNKSAKDMPRRAVSEGGGKQPKVPSDAAGARRTQSTHN